MRCTSPRASGRVALAASAFAVIAYGCAGASGAHQGGHAVTASDRESVTQSPAMLLPDTAASSPVDVLPDGTRRLVVSGMRVLERPDGSLERARDVLPGGNVRTLSLPGRLGGGLLVYVVMGGSTQVWRASSWLGQLEPVAELFGVVGEMVAGFDRVYARLLGADTSGDIKAFDPNTGEQLTLGPLPRETRIGPLAFADDWRGLVMSDFRGPMATFDAGNTWRSVPMAGRIVHQLGSRDGELVIDTAQGRYTLHASGELGATEGPDVARLPGLWGTDGIRRSAVSASTRTATPSDLFAGRRRPLRAAVEDGWPTRADDGGPGAIFAEGGALYRVLLPAGRIEQVRARAFSEELTSCHAVGLGSAFGFVCGAARGATALYRFEPPFDVREVARFSEPRAVLASSEGGWAVGGACSSGAPDAFCFVTPEGSRRDVRVDALGTVLAPAQRRDVRPVVLDGRRVAFVAPPAPGFAGALITEGQRGFSTVLLELGDAAPTLMRSRLLEGLDARDAGNIGGWVLLGEELHGISIAADGRVTLHPASANVERSVVSGGFGMDWGRGGRGAQTVDGGATWTPVNVPTFDASKPARDVAACSPVGCARRGWLRVGWGAAPGGHDLIPAPTPLPSKVNLAPARGFALRCEPTGQVAGPATPNGGGRLLPSQERPTSGHQSPSTGRSLATPTSNGGAVTPSASSASSPWPWSSFRGVTPPALARGESGVQAGTEPPFSTQARLYAWGARDGDWRVGHWLSRFEDRFDMHGAHSTAVAPSLWADGEHAAEALGVSPGQAVSWSALLDPSGSAVILVAQRGAGHVDLFAAAEGEPPVQIRAAPESTLPVPSSVVRVGATWFLLATTTANNVWSSTIYRVDALVARPLLQMPRVPMPLGEMPPRLMRRTDAAAVGVLVLGAAGFGQTVRDWYVLPIDEERRALADPVRLVGSDLEGRVPARCSARQEGWLVNTELSLAPAVRVTSQAAVSLSAVELRLRLDEGAVCAEGLAARFDGWLAPPAAPLAPPDTAGERLPLVATHPESGRRWMLRCE